MIITSDHRHAFNVPSTAIAEYSPTLMVNVPDNSRTVACPRSDGMAGPICKTLKHLFLCIIISISPSVRTNWYSR